MASVTKRRFTDEFKREAVALWGDRDELGIRLTMYFATGGIVGW